MLNVVALMGRLTADPELKTTPSGVPVCRFTLAVDRNYAKSGTERQADFINCLAWRTTAEFISKYFVKGQLIVLDGSIQTGSYTDNNGNKRYNFDILVNSVNFTGDKRNTGNSGNSNSSTNNQNNSYTDVPIPDSDDSSIPALGDLPF